MKKEYGELMSLLLHHRERYGTEEEFCRFIADSVRGFSHDLRDFGVEISLRPQVLDTKRRKDWNTLKIGCE